MQWMMYVPSPLYIYVLYILTSTATIHSRSSWVYQLPAASRSRSKASRIGQGRLSFSLVNCIPFHFLSWIYTIPISKVSQPRNQSVPRYTYLISAYSTLYRDLAIVRKHVPNPVNYYINVSLLRIIDYIHISFSHIFIHTYIYFLPRVRS